MDYKKMAEYAYENIPFYQKLREQPVTDWEQYPVIDKKMIVEYMTHEQAKDIVDLSKLPADASPTLRIVRIGDYDACACIGLLGAVGE